MHLDITVNEFHLGRLSGQQAHGNPHHRARLQLARVFDFVARLQLVPQAGRAKVALGQAFQRIARLHYVRRFVLLVCGPGARGERCHQDCASSQQCCGQGHSESRRCDRHKSSWGAGREIAHAVGGECATLRPALKNCC